MTRSVVLVAVASLAAGCGGEAPPGSPGRSASYDALTALFAEWRAFHRPPLADGVPDYSARAMEAQYRELRRYQERLAAIDASAWPIAQQVDYHLVRAEMNGLEFDHRVLRPWARNPAFYVQVFSSQSDTPAHEGPHTYGAIELWTYRFPLDSAAAARLRAELATVPKLLQQARTNLDEDPRDLWLAGIRAVADQASDLRALATRVAGTSPELDRDIQRAIEATDGFRAWLEAEAPSRTGRSGVGIDNYDWYLANVHLVPYTWRDLVTIMQRELARAHAALRLEEHRNRHLPPLVPVASAAEHSRRFNAAVTEYMAFLRDRQIVSIRDYMDQALRERLGQFSPAEPREFFSEVDYRAPVIMRTHGYHWFDLARMAREPHASPIRRGALLYNIFDTRAEGLATGMEEMMMHAGLLDSRPRARELIWVLLAQRAARALGDLYMHANQFTMDQAIKFAVEWTPRGWLRPDGSTVWGEQHLYLQQPSYGTSYISGKIQIEQLMAVRARQLGDDFSIKRFMDELNATGVIPVSLIRWELTGQDDEIKALLAAQR
ncbi:MAG TPA: DUF885 family protein [Gemmatimonadales bacterium]|nr:DUF885 family protein [Gemmatimonadales bacterium]